MELFGDVGHVDSHLFLFRDIFSVSTRLMHGLLEMYHRLRNHFGHPMVLLGDEAQVKDSCGISLLFVRR
jgi:hypothetical protein